MSRSVVIDILSDTHRSHCDYTSLLTGGDLLIHCGDSDCYSEETTKTFLSWLKKVSTNCEGPYNPIRVMYDAMKMKVKEVHFSVMDVI